ncbi:uncharacterized protein LOC112563079 [Pomacea canaliculata]|uniref:uncharacterized protein LOC112563079 n=1 Tax=Pomacea canaliculata TaxID=400727 RepID=UPI000D7323C9|nr:uncharacterized protein LOC112563079 [Pomacea canaliculata]
MNTILAISALLCVAHAQLPTCHPWSQHIREEEVISLVADIVDRNGDNVITTNEIVVGFADILDINLPVSEGLILSMNTQSLIFLAATFGPQIEKAHFVQKWHERFGDAPNFASHTFDSYDQNKDGKLSMYELEELEQRIIRQQDDGDGKIQSSEFRRYLLSIYETC